ncbi:MAG: hypothetical protein ACWGQW_06575 [bacterium]
MPEENNALTIFNIAPATNNEMALALTGLKESIRRAAQANLDAVEADEEFTETEQLAMLKIEELRQVNGLDLAAVLLRAEYLQEIEAGNLITRHPAGYQTMGEMAQDQGISIAELSQTLDLANVIFPYVRRIWGDGSIPQMWEQIGKSNMRELVPVLKRIITGEEARGTVEDTANAFLDDIVATFRAADPEWEQDDEAVTQEAVEQLLVHGATLTNRRLRQQLRPDPTPIIEATTITLPDENVVVMAKLDPDQWQMFMRKLGTSVDPLPFVATRDPAQRRRDALAIPALRAIVDIINPEGE